MEYKYAKHVANVFLVGMGYPYHSSREELSRAILLYRGENPSLVGAGFPCRPLIKAFAENLDKDFIEQVFSKKSAANYGKKKKATNKKSKSRGSDFYLSEEWRALRYKALKKYGRKCLCCGATPEGGAILHVDHIFPRSKYPEMELDLSNLQVLCEDCNLGKSNTDSVDYRPAVKEKSIIEKPISKPKRSGLFLVKSGNA